MVIQAGQLVVIVVMQQAVPCLDLPAEDTVCIADAEHPSGAAATSAHAAR